MQELRPQHFITRWRTFQNYESVNIICNWTNLLTKIKYLACWLNFSEVVLTIHIFSLSLLISSLQIVGTAAKNSRAMQNLNKNLDISPAEL
jgi:hypothetical protein